MKFTINNITIECTVDEFEDLYARGLLADQGNRSSQDKDDEWLEMIKKLQPPPQPHQQPQKQDPFPTVALYGCHMPSDITWYNNSTANDATSESVNITSTADTRNAAETDSTFANIRNEYDD